jgi:hypothetical protein
MPKTIRGRVVYNRPIHFFRLTDATRILRNAKAEFGDYDLLQLLHFYEALVPRLEATLPNFFALLIEDYSEAPEALAIFRRMLTSLVAQAVEQDIDFIRNLFLSIFPIVPTEVPNGIEES